MATTFTNKARTAIICGLLTIESDGVYRWSGHYLPPGNANVKQRRKIRRMAKQMPREARSSPTPKE